MPDRWLAKRRPTTDLHRQPPKATNLP